MPDFPPQLPHGQITQVLPEVFFVTGQMRIEAPDRPILTSRNMTVIRTGTELTQANTVRLDAGGLAEIDALGEVKHVAKLGQFHGRDDAFYLDRYGAEFWAPDGMTHDRGEVTDCVLAPDQAGPSNDASVFLFETASKPEVILHLDCHGGILVSCDSLHNWSGPDEWFDDYSAQSMQEGGFFHSPNVGPGWRKVSKVQPSDFARLKALSFRHLLSAHGQPLLNSAHDAISKRLTELNIV